MIAPETTFLIQRLKAVQPGETIHYPDLNAVVGNVDVRKHYRSRLTSAIKIVKRDYGMIFVAIPDVGYQLLKVEEVAVMAESKGLSDIKRSTDRWGARLNTVDYSELPTEKSKHDYNRSATRQAFAEAAVSDEAYAIIAKRGKTELNQFKQTKDDIIAALQYGVS